MKKILVGLFLGIFFYVGLSCSSIDKQDRPLPPMNVYFSLNQQQDASPVINLKNLSEILLDLQKTGNIKQNLNVLNADLKNIQSSESFSPQDVVQSLCLLAKSKKFWTCLIGASCFASYLYTFYKLKSLELSLTKSDLWSFWKSEKSFVELISMPEQELIEQLLFDVQARYTSIKLINDFSTPLGSFFKNVDIEIQNLGLYLWLSEKVKLLHLAKVLPINEKLIVSHQERVNKLVFLKNKIWTWITRQKVTNNLEKIIN